MIPLISNDEAIQRHWYIQIKSRESGPYSFVEVLCMLYNKDLESTDMVTYRGLGQWHPASEFENFSQKNIDLSLEDNNIDPEGNDDIPFRRYTRIPLSAEVLVVTGDYAFKSECLDLSVGGCLIKLPRGKVHPDNDIKVHFYRNENIQLNPFNVAGEAVRVISAEKLKEGSSYYDLIGVQFINLKRSEREALREKIREIVFTTESDIEIQRILKRHTALSAA